MEIVGGISGSSIPVTHGIMSDKKGAIGANTNMTYDDHIEWMKTHSGLSGKIELPTK
jgi:hypothetical protein